MRWSRENEFNVQVRAASQTTGVATALLKAVIAAESAFNPRALRTEAPRPSLPPTLDFPLGGDASIGLMQLLVRTARGLGFNGSIEELYDPFINTRLGARLLRQNLDRTGGNIPSALSAYNGGWRPSLGFGTPLPNGQYGNQAYVTRILGYYDYFMLQDTTPLPGAGGEGGSVPAPFRRRMGDQLRRRWDDGSAIGGR